jgi:hypothetical protein
MKPLIPALLLLLTACATPLGEREICFAKVDAAQYQEIIDQCWEHADDLEACLALPSIVHRYREERMQCP